MEVMIVTLVLAPVVLIGLMRFGEGETQKWLAEESEGHRRWLAAWQDGGYPGDASGQRIAAGRANPREAALMRDYCILKTELVLTAEEELLDRDRKLKRARRSGFAPLS